MTRIVRSVVRRLAVALLLAASLLPLSAGSSWACSCASATSSLKEQAAAYDVIFTGRAIDVAVDDGTLVATYRVETIYRGPITSTAVVRTNSQDSACGYGIDEGNRDTIFASLDGELLVHTCSLSRPGPIKPARYGLTPTPAPPPDELAPPDGGEAEPAVAVGEELPTASTDPWLGMSIGLGAVAVLLVLALRRARANSGDA